MAFLFDTDALSEIFRKRPSPSYLEWLGTVPRSDQFASAISLGELYRGVYRLPSRNRWLERFDHHLLPAITVLPFDLEVARVYGRIRAELEAAGRMPGEADLQIAATALHHDLTVVTGNLDHFQRVPGLRVGRQFADRR